MEPVGAIYSTEQGAYVATLWVRNKRPGLTPGSYMKPLVAYTEATRMMRVAQSTANRALGHLCSYRTHHMEVNILQQLCFRPLLSVHS